MSVVRSPEVANGGVPELPTDQTPVIPKTYSDDSSSPRKSLLGGLAGDNLYFQAGFGLMGVGVALTALRQGLMVGAAALKRRLLVSVEINNQDRAYEWFLAWMAHQSGAASAGGATSRTVSWMRSHKLSAETTTEQSQTLFRLVAGPGTHWLRYSGAWMQVNRERETRSMRFSGEPWETVTLTTLSRDRHLFPQLLSEAKDLAMRSQEGKLIIHTAWGIEWKPFGQPRQKRPLHSIALDQGVGERIERDVKAFLQRRQWYADRGIPYRRGYLLHGPPGSGKTSFIQALAGSLSYDICLLNLSERGLTDDKLNHLLSNVPEESFVLVEDIDAVFNKRVQTSEDGYQSSVTFSGFLNALDGVASGEERIIFMTTNHVAKLDPALIRPGRVDLSQLFDDASPVQAKTLFTRFYRDGDGPGNLSDNELESTGRELEEMVRSEIQKGKVVSMAALQGHFIRNDGRHVLPGLPGLFAPRRA